MTALLDAPEIREAIASGREAAHTARYISEDWQFWCESLDTRMSRAIMWINRWREAATFADAQRKTGKVDLWVFGDTFIPAIEAFRHDMEEINHMLEVSSPACPLVHQSEYREAREKMAKVFEYFDRWPRTNRDREEQAIRDQAAGNFAKLIEIKDDLCH